MDICEWCGRPIDAVDRVVEPGTEAVFHDDCYDNQVAATAALFLPTWAVPVPDVEVAHR